MAKPDVDKPSNGGATARKRGRPPLPIDNETREKILTAAQRLFAQRSFTQVSVREITDAAGVSVAAINYHFGNKDGLLRALFKRSAPALLQQRNQLLKQACQLEGSAEERIRAIIHALLAPVIRWGALTETQANVPFVLRVQLDGPEDLRALAKSDTRHLKPFVKALHDAMPQLSLTEVYWRLHFLLGIEHALVHELKRLQSLSGSSCDLSDPDAVVERVLAFTLPGVMAPAPKLKPGRPSARKQTAPSGTPS